MKPQDLIFFMVLLGLLALKRSNLFVLSGLISLFLVIPLFAWHIFFTAPQRMTYYAVGFFW